VTVLGANIYIASQKASNVSAIDSAADTVAAAILVGRKPAAIAAAGGMVNVIDRFGEHLGHQCRRRHSHQDLATAGSAGIDSIECESLPPQR
jgi:YVTN family beta-propeller protein